MAHQTPADAIGQGLLRVVYQVVGQRQQGEEHDQDAEHARQGDGQRVFGPQANDPHAQRHQDNGHDVHAPTQSAAQQVQPELGNKPPIGGEQAERC
jgi:hypothetical protein